MSLKGWTSAGSGVNQEVESGRSVDQVQQPLDPFVHRGLGGAFTGLLGHLPVDGFLADRSQILPVGAGRSGRATNSVFAGWSRKTKTRRNNSQFAGAAEGPMLTTERPIPSLSRHSSPHPEHRW